MHRSGRGRQPENPGAVRSRGRIATRLRRFAHNSSSFAVDATPRPSLFSRFLIRPVRWSESIWGRSSVGRAPQWHCGGRRFDPDRLHQIGLRNAVTSLDPSGRVFDPSLGVGAVAFVPSGPRPSPGIGFACEAWPGMFSRPPRVEEEGAIKGFEGRPRPPPAGLSKRFFRRGGGGRVQAGGLPTVAGSARGPDSWGGVRRCR